MPLGRIVFMFELNWSHAEKVVARRAFDRALRNELQATIREAKERAAKISEPAELWELEDWLDERRQDINRRYDYRYSVLPIVFAHLIRDGRLRIDDLKGLRQEKLELINRRASL
jgi:Photoprotection regulator fluorescence recovery protein